MNSTTPNQKEARYALGAGILALVMWSGTAIANKVAVASMSGLTAGVLRSLLAGMIALAVCIILRLPRPSTSEDRILLVVSGFFSFAIWPILLSIGIARTSASHAAIIMAMIPIFAVLITQLIDRSLPQTGWWLGAAAAFTGTVWLVTSQSTGSVLPVDESTVAGDLIVLTGTFVCASGYVAGGKLSKKIGSPATTFWGLASALILLVPVFGFVVGDTNWSDLPVEAWMGIAWMTILSSLVGYGLWFSALGRGGISKIGSLQLAMPAVTLAAAALILGETITPKIAFIATVIVAGTWWAHRRVS